MRLWILILLLVLAALTGCRDKPASTPPRVFAAASLADVLTDVRYQLDPHGTPFLVNLAGSNQLARQILAGARADLFLSANAHWVNELEIANKLEPGSRAPLAHNQLVLIAHASRSIDLVRITDLTQTDFRYLAMGHPEAVPAGVYARQYLESIRYNKTTLWDTLSDRVAPTADVRRALAMVASDSAVLGFVYRSDLYAHLAHFAGEKSSVRGIFEVPTHAARATYEIALLRDPSPAAIALYDHLISPDARASFRKFQLIPID